jgi:hypothetical protein
MHVETTAPSVGGDMKAANAEVAKVRRGLRRRLLTTSVRTGPVIAGPANAEVAAVRRFNQRCRSACLIRRLRIRDMVCGRVCALDGAEGVGGGMMADSAEVARVRRHPQLTSGHS